MGSRSCRRASGQAYAQRLAARRQDRCLTRLTRRKEELHEPLESLRVRIIQDSLQLRLLEVHDVFTALWRGAHEQHLSHERWPLECDHLCEYAAEGESKHVHPDEP